ncbi:hypothetical protein COO60DRAFT_1140079 [Scenedesmus sp. NREL 46B-D3]|nr:hypothetical protein COO60DRAFT_1140079 [Scenedesmus sp. NREL 46B-D3]
MVAGTVSSCVEFLYSAVVCACVFTQMAVICAAASVEGGMKQTWACAWFADVSLYAVVWNGAAAGQGMRACSGLLSVAQQLP